MPGPYGPQGLISTDRLQKNMNVNIESWREVL